MKTVSHVRSLACVQMIVAGDIVVVTARYGARYAGRTITVIATGSTASVIQISVEVVEHLRCWILPTAIVMILSRGDVIT